MFLLKLILSDVLNSSFQAECQRQSERFRPIGRCRRDRQKDRNCRTSFVEQFCHFKRHHQPISVGFVGFLVGQTFRVEQNRTTQSRNRRFRHRRFAKCNCHRTATDYSLAGEIRKIAMKGFFRFLLMSLENLGYSAT